MDVAQSELDIYLSTEKKEKAVFDTMKENLEKATTNFNDKRGQLEELESNMPKWTQALGEKQAEMQQVHTHISVIMTIDELTFVNKKK